MMNRTKLNAGLAITMVWLTTIACQAARYLGSTPTVPAPTPTNQPTPSPTPIPTPISLDLANPSQVEVEGMVIQATAFARGPGSTLYAGTWGSGIYISRNGGDTWAPLDESDAQVRRLELLPGLPDQLLVATANHGLMLVPTEHGSMDQAPVRVLDQDILSTAVDPSTPGVAYVGTPGGVFRTEDSGRTWSPFGLIQTEVDALVVEPDQPQTVYAGTADGGIFKLTDDGHSWYRLGLAGVPIRSLALDPGNPDVIYAGTAGRGVVRINLSGGSPLGPSDDLAIKVDQVASPFAHAVPTAEAEVTDAAAGNLPALTAGPFGGTVTDIKIDPVSPTTVYAATEHGVFKSTDNGESWHQAGLSSKRVYALAVAPSDSDVVYAATRAQGFFMSDDAGITWRSSADPLIQDKIIYSLVVDPSDPKIVYAGGRGANVDGFTLGTWGGGVFKSTDGGVTWTDSNTGLPEGWVYSLLIDSTSPGTLYAGTHTMGVFKTVDGGGTWIEQSHGLSSLYSTDSANMKIRSLAMDPADPLHLLIGTWGGGSLFASDDGGQSWHSDNKSASLAHVRVVAFNPVIPHLAYAGLGRGGALFRDKDDPQAAWAPFGRQVQGSWDNFSVVSALALNPTTGMTIFMGVNGAGILRSTDSGLTWTLADNGLVATTVTDLIVDQENPGTLYAATDGAGVFQSRDGGLSWSRHLWATPWDNAEALIISGDGRHLLVATANRGLIALLLQP